MIIICEKNYNALSGRVLVWMCSFPNAMNWAGLYKACSLDVQSCNRHNFALLRDLIKVLIMQTLLIVIELLRFYITFATENN